jgi:hypothetical protein
LEGIERLKNLPPPIVSHKRTARQPDEDCGKECEIFDHGAQPRYVEAISNNEENYFSPRPMTYNRKEAEDRVSEMSSGSSDGQGET